MIKNRIEKLEKGGEYIQPLVVIASSYQNEEKQIADCIAEHGRKPDKVVRLIGVEPGTMIQRYGGEIVPG